MGTEELDGIVRQFLTSEFKIDPAAIRPEASFEEMGLDSLDVVSMVMGLEDRLGVEIPEGELEGVERYGQAIDMLVRKVGAHA